MKMLAPLLAVALLAAACGGGTASTVAPSGTRADSSKALTAYLAAMKPVRDDLRGRSDELNATLQAVTSADLTTLDAGAKAVSDTIDAYQADLEKEGQITPPHGLELAHQSHVAAIQSLSLVLSDMGGDLRRHDLAAIAGWKSTVMPRLAEAEKSVAGWKTTVMAYAAQHGVEVPVWVTDVGTN